MIKTMKSDLIMYCQKVSDLFQALLFEYNFEDMLRNRNFKFY